MSLLKNVTKGKVQRPPLMLIYGPDGVGKTALAAGAPNPIFLGSEQGTDHMDVARLGMGSMSDLTSTLADLATGQYEYKTVVIDTLDWLEASIYAHVIKKFGKPDFKSIEDFGYGKGRVHALETWKEIVTQFDAVRAKGIGLVLLAHSMVKKFEDPTTPQGYERYQLKLQSGAGSDVAALMREYVDVVAFLNFETLTSTDDKRRGFGGQDRLFYTQRTPSFDAKNRYGLPSPIRIPDDPGNTGKGWATIMEEIGKAQARGPEDTTALEAEVDALVAQVTDATLRGKAGEAAAKAKGDTAELVKIRARLLAVVSKGKEKS